MRVLHSSACDLEVYIDVDVCATPAEATLADLAIITTGQHAYRRRDGVAAVPAAPLGP